MSFPNSHNTHSNRYPTSSGNDDPLGIRGVDNSFIRLGGGTSARGSTNFKRQFDMNDILAGGHFPPLVPKSGAARFLGETYGVPSGSKATSNSRASSKASATSKNTKPASGGAKGSDAIGDSKWRDPRDLNFPEGFQSVGTQGDRFYVDAHGRFILRELTDAEKATGTTRRGRETYGTKFGRGTIEIINRDYLSMGDRSGGISPDTPW
ncbi:hypothetical protein I302_106810 [Kwoniella bestiolae CBS 10118]|uniref:Uncharacterized protein n=1 Tax=Kwoniella bestiolae CBS 10118 TaxID=1296100 RepID=A0A1B9G0A8_9TREE|nr:hypothetical protein I302_05924 [Kwoniella bestiolae CBS 10118]OCF24464.1 hypothetical protein I302_05924 [Kwoniella bestiolae CBS 10118]